jgi:hypothetical protein
MHRRIIEAIGSKTRISFDSDADDTSALGCLEGSDGAVSIKNPPECPEPEVAWMPMSWLVAVVQALRAPKPDR